MYKKFLIIFFTIFLNLINVKYQPYSETGHEQFQKLEFVDGNCQLLISLDDGYIKRHINALKTKFFGWQHEIIYEYEKATYVGQTIFSRSNKTSEKYVFSYSLSEITYEERSFNISGTISAKETGKIKKVEVVSQQSLTIQYGSENSIKTTESSNMDITVYPNKKVSLRVSGEARISSGFSKYFVFWICIKKGAWEIVDVVNSYFELVEENA